MGHRASTVRREPVVEPELTTCVCVCVGPHFLLAASRVGTMRTCRHMRVLMVRLVGNATEMVRNVQQDGTVRVRVCV